METRRLAAANDLLNGVSQSQVARRYCVSRTTASRWHRSIVHTGVDGMRKRKATGRPSRLTADQVDGIRSMYAEGALAHGFCTDRWTTGRLAEAIERRFGIRYDQDHVGRLMHKYGLREKRFRYAPARVSETCRARTEEHVGTDACVRSDHDVYLQGEYSTM